MIIRRALRVAGTIVVLAVGLMTTISVTAEPSPASAADTVIDGCTIVSNPTSSDFTDCPNTNFSGADLLGVNLDYADLSGSTFANAQLARCVLVPPPNAPFSCSNATFRQATLTQAVFTGAATTSCVSFSGTPTITTNECAGVDLSDANLQSTSLSGTDLSDVNLSSADLVGASVSGATFVASYPLSAGLLQYFGTNFTGADLAGLDLSGFDLSVATLTRANLSGSQLLSANLSAITEAGTTFGGQLGQANLTDANLTGANLSGATLTGANFSGTLLLPVNQHVPATSPDGAVVVWPTPPSLPGATPGRCAPASGSPFPLFSRTPVTCQVLDSAGDIATGTFDVLVEPTTRYFTRILRPSAGSVLSGTRSLVAAARDARGVTKVQFELTGGHLDRKVIAVGTPSRSRWIAKWQTTTVANGTYTVMSVATDAASHVSTSSGVRITVDNPPPG